MSAADKTKLDGIATGAEVNQNAFSNVAVGSTTVSADSKTDTLTLVAGPNVTLTPDATNDKITIAATDTTYSDATTSTSGLMSSSDKIKLNGIAAGATANSISAVNVTAASGSWSSATPPTQTVSVTGVTASNNIIVSIASTATSTQYAAAAAGQLLCTAQGTGEITLTCYGTEPTENIPLTVMIVG